MPATPFRLASARHRRRIPAPRAARTAENAGDGRSKQCYRISCVGLASQGLSSAAERVGLENGLSRRRRAFLAVQREGRLMRVGGLKDWARSIRRDAHAIYLAARHPRTPWYVKALAIGIAAYALSPIDLIPDFIPVVGFLDEIILLPIAIVAVVKLIPADVMAESRATAALAAELPVSLAAAVIIVLVWATAIGLAGWLAYRYFFG
jgi:uncharacterized membrane protein YkvA (DUF1232 family)